jgi:PAS domain-containing protein
MTRYTTVPNAVDSAHDIEPGRELALALERSPAAIALTTLAGEVICGNSAAESLFGAREVDRAQARNLTVLCTEPAQIAMLEEVARDGKERQFSAFTDSPDRGRRQLICRVTRVAGKNAIPAWLTFSAMEYDERATPEVVPFDAAQSLRKVMRETLIAGWMIRVDDQNDWVNGPMEWSSGMFDLLDVTRSGARPKFARFLEAILPEDRATLLERLTRVVHERSACELVYRVRPRNGLVRVIRSRVVLEDGIPGETPDKLWGVEEDVTALFRMHPTVPMEVALLDTIGLNLDAPVYAVDADLRYVYFNELHRATMQHLYGIQALIGARAFDGGIPSPRRKVVLSNLRRALTGVRAAENLTLAIEGSDPVRFDLTYAPIVARSKTLGVLILGNRLESEAHKP